MEQRIINQQPSETKQSWLTFGNVSRARYQSMVVFCDATEYGFVHVLPSDYITIPERISRTHVVLFFACLTCLKINNGGGFILLSIRLNNSIGFPKTKPRTAGTRKRKASRGRRRGGVNNMQWGVSIKYCGLSPLDTVLQKYPNTPPSHLQRPTPHNMEIFEVEYTLKMETMAAWKWWKWWSVRLRRGSGIFPLSPQQCRLLTTSYIPRENRRCSRWLLLCDYRQNVLTA